MTHDEIETALSEIERDYPITARQAHMVYQHVSWYGGTMQLARVICSLRLWGASLADVLVIAGYPCSPLARYELDRMIFGSDVRLRAVANAIVNATKGIE